MRTASCQARRHLDDLDGAVLRAAELGRVVGDRARVARASLSRRAWRAFVTTSDAWRVDTPAAAKPWIEKMARLGYAAKGIVYLLLGWLAALAAADVREVPSGSRGVFAVVLAQPLGEVLLAGLAIGLVGYVAWRLVEVVADPQRKGNDAKGLAVRAYYLGSAAVHVGLVVAALRLLGGNGGGGDEAAGGAARLMAQPFGRWLVALAGLAFLVAAAREAQLATGPYRKKVRVDRVPEPARRWVGPVVVFGLVSRGLVFAIVGAYLVLSAIRADPGEAKGLGGALHAVESQPAGEWLLGIVAAGLAAYGVFQLLEARYRAIRP